MVQLFTQLNELDPISLLGSTFTSSCSNEVLQPISSEHLHIDDNRQTVYWIRQGLIIRKFSYQKGAVLAAEFAVFRNDNDFEVGKNERNKFAVIFLSDVAHIYRNDGISYSTSMPFRIKRVFPFEKGLILERSLESDVSLSVNPKFFAMTDPILDLGLVVSSSISAISPHEELIYFAPSSKSSLCVTFTQNDDGGPSSLTIYHIRHLTKNNKSRAAISSTITNKRKSSLKRRSSSFHHDEKHEKDHDRFRDSFTTNVSGTASGLPNDRSSLRLEVPAISSDRRTSLDPKVDIQDQSPFEMSSLRKETILTQITSCTINSSIDDLKTISLTYDDIEVLTILNKRDSTLVNYSFKTSSGPIGIPILESTNILKATDAILISSEEPSEESLLLVLSSNHLYLYNPLVNIRSLDLAIPSNWASIESLVSSTQNIVKLRLTNGEYHECSVTFQPNDDVTKKCFDGLGLLLDRPSFINLKFLWSSVCSISDDNHWRAFAVTIVYCLIDFLPDFSPSNDVIEKHHEFIQSVFSTAFIIKQSDESNLWNRPFDSETSTHIILALHIIREEYKLDINCRNKVDNIGLLLSSIIELSGWSEKWLSFYEIPSFKDIIKNTTAKIHQPLEDPPNIFQTLLSLLSPPLIHFITFEDLIGMKKTKQHSIIPRIETMIDLFSTMSHRDATAKSALKHILKLGLCHSDLDNYPEGIRIPILEIIAFLKDDENSKGDVDTFMLLQRNDLIAMVRPSTSSKQSYTPVKDSPPEEIKSIIQNISERDSIGAWDGQSEADRITISRLIFSDDRRFYEVSKLLQSSRGHVATLIQPNDSNEHEWMTRQHSLFKATALRTFAIPFGRAALFYSSRRPLATEKYLIPKLNFNVVIRPSNVTISAPRSFLTEENILWGHFHNGVSSGLSISKEYTHISGSWIVFNRPQNLNSSHAGFLLGLGLNGHLTKLQEWHIYNYLGPKHIPTSIALLIGMAASHLGSCDMKLTKVLSVHVAALLPIGSSDLNVSILVQSAGLIGVGLLYYNSQHRRMTEVLLSEVDVTAGKSHHPAMTIEKDECYRLSAGISLGLINIGNGNKLKGLTDMRVVDKLLELAVKSSDIQKTDNLDKSVSGSLVALMLLFLKTNNKSIANKISVPDTEQRLNYVRPDLILLRTLAKNLIMWNTIGNDGEWIEFSIPNILRFKYSLESIQHLTSDQMIYYNVIAGLCLSMGLKHVSTGDLKVKETLIWYLDQFIRLCEIPVNKHDEIITRQCLMNCQGAVSLALASVMVGSGDLDVLRRLRRLYGRVSKDVTFGSNMANEMAMGILFLGGGQYSFANTNFAIASLVISFYPLLPTQLKDSRSYLQALRHFWVLASEPRCLVVRHDSTKVPTNMDIVLELKNGQTLYRRAPCIIPALDEIARISTNSNKYFKVVIDLTDENSQLTKAFLKTRTLYVHDKLITQIGTATFSATLQALTLTNKPKDNLENLIETLSAVSNLDKLQKNLLLTNEAIETASIDDKLRTTAIDLKLTLESMAKSPQSIDDLWNLKLLFAFDDNWSGSSEVKVLSRGVLDEVKLLVWKLKQQLRE